MGNLRIWHNTLSQKNLSIREKSASYDLTAKMILAL